MTDENTYTAPDGTRYRAEAANGSYCYGCAFEGSRITECDNIAQCCAGKRVDNRYIIWIKETP